jgi:Gluconate 2-dehydrogenase subunit 3
MDRRTSLKWVVAAAASLPFLNSTAFGAGARRMRATGNNKGVGSDPKLIHEYRPGELWSLTFTPQQREVARVLSDMIIPADANSPSASAVGVIDFLDEWVSAPYDDQQHDRMLILDGFVWLGREAAKRFSKPFEFLGDAQRKLICDDICFVASAKPQFVSAAKFFARYRDLTAGGFYTTPQGRRDLQYVGNVPMTRFEGPPLDVLKQAGLA